MPCRSSFLSVKLDQILEDQAAPAIPVRLHKQATFRKPAKVDRREAELIRKRPDFLGSSLVIARQENDSPAPMCHRVLVEDGSDQMVEALDQPAAGEGLANHLGGRLSAQLLIRNRSEEHTSELQSLMRISYAVFCLKK